MKREDLIELAKQQAAEIARAGHNGWGNTMLALAVALESSAPVGVVEALSELVDLMQGVIDGEYTPDSFTLQPARAALAQQPAAVEAKDAEIEALRAEVERMTRCLANANAGFEEFERRWYLEQDRAERLAEALREA